MRRIIQIHSQQIMQAHDMVGAMENWGLVIGTMNMLLVDPVRGDQQAKKQVASTQSHEVAHMWYANLCVFARRGLI
jgi:aminopeptidase N